MINTSFENMLRINILAHRGIWKTHEQKNTLQALTYAVKLGFGLEFDVRDYCGSVVISHNPPVSKILTLEDLFTQISAKVKKEELSLAINVKCDGIERELMTLISLFGLEPYSFLFDLSIPTMIQFSKMAPKNTLQIATRLSEYETVPVLLSKCTHIWVDCFDTDWYNPKMLVEELYKDKKIVFVSPELHGRHHMKVWEQLRDVELPLYLCTDFPEEAKNYFAKK